MKHLRVPLMSENVVSSSATGAAILMLPLLVYMVTGPTNDRGNATETTSLFDLAVSATGCTAQSHRWRMRTIVSYMSRL